MKKIIATQKAPKAVGPYSQAIKAGDFIFCSGQIGISPASNELVEGIENQTKQVMKNLQAVLEESKATFENVVQVQIFLKDMNDYAKVNEIYGSYFQKDPPARAAVQVASLPKDALVEIMCIAYKGK
jgi:2-iminobutanoate/2-iminopropanoate deaminase